MIAKLQILPVASRIVEERFGEEKPVEEVKKPFDKKKALILQSPARFTCKLCGSKYRTRKALKDHEAKEMEERKKLDGCLNWTELGLRHHGAVAASIMRSHESNSELS